MASNYTQQQQPLTAPPSCSLLSVGLTATATAGRGDSDNERLHGYLVEQTIDKAGYYFLSNTDELQLTL